jgi:hypothetical protein
MTFLREWGLAGSVDRRRRLDEIGAGGHYLAHSRASRPQEVSVRLPVLLLLIVSLPGVAAAQARFEGSKGVGTRLDSRKCDFTFTKE